MQSPGEQLSSAGQKKSTADRPVEELSEFTGDAITITGDRRALENKVGMELSDIQIGSLFGAIHGSLIEIAPDGPNVDVWTSSPWFETPLYYSVERDETGIIQTINDFFLKPIAPKTLGTRMMARMIFQATRIPKFASVLATATRLYTPKDGGAIREVNGYYFFPRLGFNAEPKNADEYVEIPKEIRGIKLTYIMRDPQLRQWWKENGQTIEVRFKVRSKRSLQVLTSYLLEKGIPLPDIA